MLNCLIVDDEELARLLLQNYAERLPELRVLGQVKNPVEALDWLHRERVDLLFLDIQMPELSGLDLLRSLSHPPQVILTTAYSQYALDGYALNVVDYLLKPIRFERFVQAVNKAADLIALKAAAAQAQGKVLPAGEAAPSHWMVRADHKVHRLRLSDIAYIQSMREYVAYHLPEGRILALGALKALEESLPCPPFLRVHKSFIVNISAVRAIEGNILHLDKVKIPIGASYREQALPWLTR